MPEVRDGVAVSPFPYRRGQPAEVAPEKASEVLPFCSMPPELNVYALMDYRAGQVRRREFRPLGILEKIMLEKSAVADVSDRNPLTRVKSLACSIDYYSQGPLVGMTPDNQDALICSRMIHPPDLPDPEWRMPYPPTKFVDGIPVPEIPPRIPQRLRDRASGILPPPRSGPWQRITQFVSRREARAENDFWFVFQPVHQVLLILADRTGLAMIECQADITGRHTVFLYNPAREEGHLVFGNRRLEYFRA